MKEHVVFLTDTLLLQEINLIISSYKNTPRSNSESKQKVLKHFLFYIFIDDIRLFVLKLSKIKNKYTAQLIFMII